MSDPVTIEEHRKALTAFASDESFPADVRSRADALAGFMINLTKCDCAMVRIEVAREVAAFDAALRAARIDQ